MKKQPRSIHILFFFFKKPRLSRDIIDSLVCAAPRAQVSSLWGGPSVGSVTSRRRVSSSRAWLTCANPETEVITLARERLTLALQLDLFGERRLLLSLRFFEWRAVCRKTGRRGRPSVYFEAKVRFGKMFTTRRVCNRRYGFVSIAPRKSTAADRGRITTPDYLGWLVPHLTFPTVCFNKPLPLIQRAKFIEFIEWDESRLLNKRCLWKKFHQLWLYQKIL